MLIPRPTGFGAYQSYYLQQYSNTDSATISLIGGLQVACLYLGGPFSGRAVDVFGPKLVIGSGTIICTFSLMMLSLTSAIWQVSLAGPSQRGELTSALAIAGLPLSRLAVRHRDEPRLALPLLLLLFKLTCFTSQSSSPASACPRPTSFDTEDWPSPSSPVELAWGE